MPGVILRTRSRVAGRAPITASPEGQFRPLATSHHAPWGRSEAGGPGGHHSGRLQCGLRVCISCPWSLLEMLAMGLCGHWT